MSWNDLAQIVEESYGSEVDYESEFFVCPICGEPIYADDWAQEILMEGPYCPICGEILHEETN